MAFKWHYLYPPSNSSNASNYAQNLTLSRCYLIDNLDANGNIVSDRAPEYLIDGSNNDTTAILQFTYSPGIEGMGYAAMIGTSAASLQVVQTSGNLSMQVKPGQMLYVYQLCNNTRPADLTTLPSYSF